MYPEDYLSHNWRMKRAVNNKIRARLSTFSGTILDLGCGSRPFETDILGYASRYIGVDWGNTLHGLDADIIADLNKALPMNDGTADHVVSFEVLEHLSEPGIMLSEAFRVLRRGGTLTLSVPFQWWVHEAPWDFQRFTHHGLEYQLSKAGFVDIEITPTTGFWTMWILKLNYQLVRIIRGPRLLRKVLRALLVPFWWSGQMLAPAIDRHWREDRETAGYFATARKA